MSVQQVFSEEALAPYFEVKIEGSPLRQEIVDDLLEIVVENSLNLPDACTLRFHDWDPTALKFRWVDEPSMREGKTIEVKLGMSKNNLTKVFDGEITAVEMDAAGHMTPILVLRCVSRAHRFHRNRVRTTYQNTKDSDIVSQIASRVGLQAESDQTSKVYKWICQNNLSDWEFVQMLASRNGFRAWVEGQKLMFKKVKEADESAGDLEWGLNLRSFRPRLSTHGQVNEVMVRGWDPQSKRPVISKKQPSDGVKFADIGESRKGGQVANSAFGDAKIAVVNWPVESQDEADALAQSIMDHRETGFVEAHGLCYGNPAIKPGTYVDVKKMGERFSGKYYVTAATHTYTPAEGYTTQFGASGKSAESLGAMLSDGQHFEQRQERIYGVAVGIVTNNDDPDNLGRIKVKFPWLSDDVESWWVRISAPMAGPDRGFMFLPEVDDEVLVAFEHGDVRFPYMIGALWNGQDKSVEQNSKAVQGGKVVHRVVKTRKGHIVMLDDTDSGELIKLTTQGGHYVCLDDSSGKVCIEMKTRAGHTVKLDDTNKKIEIIDMTGSNSMKIDSSSGNIDIKCVGDFSVQAAKDIKLQAGLNMNVTVGMSMSTTIGASESRTVSASQTISVMGAASHTFSGGATISAGAAYAVTAGVIKLN